MRIAQMLRDYHDVVDADFLAAFPEVDVVKAHTVDELAAALDGAEVFFTYNSAFTPETAKIISAHGQSLKWMQFATVGIDIAEEHGLPDNVLITNIGDISQTALAGHAMALMLGVMRGFHRYEPYRADHNWARNEFSPDLIPATGGTMVILGMGRIGQDVARKAKAFDMEVICVTRADQPAPFIDRVVKREDAGSVLGEADVLMIAMPLDDETRNFIDAEKIALLKSDAIVVNVSRGQVVDEAALTDALKAHRIKGAGLDAFADEPLSPASPLWDLENVLMTPHIAGQGGHAQKQGLSKLVQENLRLYLDGKPLRSVVRKF
ncbi:MAG: D-2-hydroxyacid dehydrogenase [Alphaproteobacteria bacterium]